MANRSYLYSVDTVPTKTKKPKPVRSVSEFPWDVPLAHKILMTGSPKQSRSLLWAGNLGISADYAVGVARLLAFLDALAKTKGLKDKKDFEKTLAETKKVLAHKKYKGKFFHLEAGEIFDMEGGGPAKRCVALVKECAALGKKVDDAIAGKGKAGRLLTDTAKTWVEELGLYWSDVLYFDFG